MRRAFTLVESAVLLASLIVVSVIGSSIHRWMWSQAELMRYRAAMQDVTDAVRAVQFQASDRHRRLELRVDASQRCLQVVEVQRTWGRLIETVRRTVWLPKGLEIADAPTVLGSPSDGRASIVVLAPAYNRMFQLTTSRSGGVQLHEEQTL